MGRTVVLNLLVASGLCNEKAGAPWAEDFTLATLCVALIRIGRGDLPVLGWRIVALIAMITTGIVGCVVDARTGTVIILSTLAVLLDIIQDHHG